MADAAALLKVNELVAGYGKKQVLNGINLEVAQGEVVALVGHNGAGKSTLLKTVFGLLPAHGGQVWFQGKLLGLQGPREMLQLGAAYVPQGNRVFASLTVGDNLEIGGVTLGNEQLLRERFKTVFEYFPLLRSRLKQRAGTLSGGEQQMVAIANALLVAPRLLLIDEPSLGLAPPLASKTLGRIRTIATDFGTSVLIAEQKVREVITMADRVYVLRNGKVSFSDSTKALDDVKLREAYL